MKRLIIMFLVIGITMFIYSCSEQSPTAPEISQNDQSATSLEKKIIEKFTGTSEWVKDISFGEPPEILSNGKLKLKGMISEWYENTSCSMVTGQSIWTVNWLIDADWSRAKLWGTADINVGVKEDGDPVLGTWQLLWHGRLTEGIYDEATGFFSGGKIVVKAIGKGKSGIVKGMIGHWTYTMNIAEGFVYSSHGFIVKIHKPWKKHH